MSQPARLITLDGAASLSSAAGLPRLDRAYWEKLVKQGKIPAQQAVVPYLHEAEVKDLLDAAGASAKLHR